MRGVDIQRTDGSVWKSGAGGGPVNTAVDGFLYSHKWSSCVKHEAVCRIHCNTGNDGVQRGANVEPTIAAVYTFEDTGDGGGIDNVVCFIDRDAMSGIGKRNTKIALGPTGRSIRTLVNAQIGGGVESRRCIGIKNEIVDYVSVGKEHEGPVCAGVDGSKDRTAKGRRVKSGRCNWIYDYLASVSTEAVIDGGEVAATVSALEHPSGRSGIDDRWVCWIDRERVDGELR